VLPSPAPGSAGRIPDDSLTSAAGLTGGLVFAVGARDIPGQCCLRTLALKTAAGRRRRARRGRIEAVPCGRAGAISVLKICFSFSAASGKNSPTSAESFFSPERDGG